MSVEVDEEVRKILSASISTSSYPTNAAGVFPSPLLCFVSNGNMEVHGNLIVRGELTVDGKITVKKMKMLKPRKAKTTDKGKPTLRAWRHIIDR